MRKTILVMIALAIVFQCVSALQPGGGGTYSNVTCFNVTLSPVAPAQTYYPIYVTMSKLSGTSGQYGTFSNGRANIIIYTGGANRTDWKDVNFTSGDGLTGLSDWRINGSIFNNASSSGWDVNVPSIPLDNTSKVCVYYGNSSQSSESYGFSGLNTYTAWDDFLDASYNTTKWKKSSGLTFTQSAGIATSSTTSASQMLNLSTEYGVNYSATSQIKMADTTIGHYPGVGWDSRSTGGTKYAQVAKGDPNHFTYYLYDTSATSGNLMTGDSTNYHIFEVIRNGTTSFIPIADGNTVAVTSNFPTTTLGTGLPNYASATTSTATYDWFILRKRVFPEPGATNFVMTDPATIVTSFTVNNTLGYAPMPIYANDTTTGGSPSTWDWNWGDGTSHSTTQNPEHTYSAHGNYTITLITDLGSTSKTSIFVKSIGDYFNVSASDSSSADKAVSDYICDGSDDQLTVNAAIDESILLNATSAPVHMFNGNYSVSDQISPGSNTTMWLDTSARVFRATGGDIHYRLLRNKGYAGSGNDNINITGGVWDGNDLNVASASSCTGYITDENVSCGLSVSFENMTNLKFGNAFMNNSVFWNTHLRNVTGFDVRNLYVNSTNTSAGNGRDGVHMRSPIQNGTVTNITSPYMRDDTISFISINYRPGPIYNVTIDGVNVTKGFNAVRLLGFNGQPIHKIRVYNVTGAYTRNIFDIGSYNLAPYDSNIYDVIFNNVVANMTSTTDSGAAVCRGVYMNGNNTETKFLNMTINNVNTIDNSKFFWVDPGYKNNTIYVADTYYNDSTSGGSHFVYMEPGSEIKTLTIRNSHIYERSTLGASAYAGTLDNAAILPNVSLTNVAFRNYSYAVYLQGSTSGTPFIQTCNVTTTNGVGVVGTSASQPYTLYDYCPDYTNASFTQAPNPSSSGQSVQFNDTTPDALTWNWTFGDIGGSNTSTIQNPTHTYSSNGVYTVMLNITNTTGAMHNTSATHTVANATGFTPQDVWQTQLLLQTWHITDSGTGLPIPVVNLQDTAMATYTTTNGTGYLTETFGASNVVFTSTGYTSRSISYFFDSEATHDVQLTPSAPAPVPNTNVIYSPRLVRLRAVDEWRTPLTPVTITAYYIENTLPNHDPVYLQNAFGISADVVSLMMNSSVAMSGVTGIDGSNTFSMFPALTYNITIENATMGVSCQQNLAPADVDYVLYCPTNAQKAASTPLAQTLNRSYIWVTEPNASFVTINASYQDPDGLTSNVIFNVTVVDNNTVIYSHNFGNPGTSQVLDNYTMPNIRGMQITSYLAYNRSSP